MARSFDAVLFDFDGTLADSYAAIAASVNHVRAHRGKTPLEETYIRLQVGHGLHQLMRDLLPDSDPDENARIYREHHPSVMFSHTRLLPGAMDLLRELKERGFKCGVCSNKPSAITKQLCTATGIDPYLQTVLGPEDVARPKPSPDMLNVACRNLETAKEGVLYIGDMTIDIETGKAAGIVTWAMPTGSNDAETLQKAGPDRILPDLAAVRAALFAG